MFRGKPVVQSQYAAATSLRQARGALAMILGVAQAKRPGVKIENCRLFAVRYIGSAHPLRRSIRYPYRINAGSFGKFYEPGACSRFPTHLFDRGLIRIKEGLHNFFDDQGSDQTASHGRHLLSPILRLCLTLSWGEHARVELHSGLSRRAGQNHQARALQPWLIRF